MHPQQKHARFNLIVIASALVPALLGYAVLFSIIGPRRATGTFGFMSICALLAFGGAFYHRSKDWTTVTMDERDEDIRRRAMMIALRVGWVLLTLICMVPWFFVSLRYGLERAQEPVVSYDWLMYGYWAACLLLVSTWSVSVLVLYRKGAGDDAA